MHWPRPKPIPLPIQCFIQRVEKERLLPRRWFALPHYWHHDGKWEVHIYRDPRIMECIPLSLIEQDIVHCLDVLLPGIVARTKETHHGN